MKTLNKFIGGLAVVFMLTFCISADGQLQFTQVKVINGGAIQVHWQSESNAVYRIEYADHLVDVNDGGTTWTLRYENYPAFGTNTFWADAGNLGGEPVVLHPRDDAMRFYRVVQMDTNDLANAPQVSVISPTNNAVLTGDFAVSVTVTSSLSVDSIRLFVDGQEVGYHVDSATNFVINTCQFANGAHEIFAIAENSSGSETTDETPDFAANLGVSPRISVTFDNYITAYRGKLEFQDPDLAETNRFTADFAGYADWTLTITNESGVTVRTVTGTGFSMAFEWDGTDNGGTTLPSGGYGAVLSATNSSSSMMASMLHMMPPFIGDAIAKGKKSYCIDPPPMPPVRTNGEWVAWEKIYGPLPSIEVPIADKYFELAAAIEELAKGGSGSSGGGITLDAAGDSASGGQTTVLQPMRYIRGRGTFGVAGQGNHPYGTTFGNNTRPNNGLFGYVSLNVFPGSYPKLRTVRRILEGFYNGMYSAGYRLKLQKLDSNLHASDLRKPSKGGSSVFNNVNIGLLIGHGVYGTSPDYTIAGSGPLQSYYPIWEGGNGYNWVRLSEFDFGSPGANGLRWMSILNCNNLEDSVYQDCWDKEVLPVNDDLHLLCGARTLVYMVSNFGSKYSSALTGQNGVTRRTVKESWFFAGTESQSQNPSRSVTFRVVGWPACFNDDLVSFSDPNSGNPADITFEDRQVTPW